MQIAGGRGRADDARRSRGLGGAFRLEGGAGEDRRIFVDTSAWVALWYRRDQNHQAASSLLHALGEASWRLVTSSDVFDETVTHLRVGIGHLEAVGKGALLLDPRVVSLVDVDVALRHEAWRLFQRYDDQLLSFTDCTSMAVMKRLEIDKVFSFDSDFEKVGFVRVC